jgi:hypothetical protein
VQPQRHNPRHNQTTITADAAQLDKADFINPNRLIGAVTKNSTVITHRRLSSRQCEQVNAEVAEYFAHL